MEMLSLLVSLLVLQVPSPVPQSSRTIFPEVYAAFSDSIATDSLSRGDSIAVFARAWIGTPYKYGARGPEAFDCSGFTRYVFGNFNIELPASSRTQFHAGLNVPSDSVQAGDLIILTSPNSQNRPGHVGVISQVADGEIFFIHSSSYRGVVEDRLNSYYRKRLLAFRRISD